LNIFVPPAERNIISNFAFRTVFVIFAIVQVPKAMNTVIAGSLRGAGDIKWIMWINIITVMILEIGTNWAGSFIFGWGLLGIWTVQLVDELLKSNINYLRFRGGKWKLIRI
ncbi:hypothetical protein KA005_68565, partial [bacterium]|nr:hypothetical protein [bacterium]